MFLPIVCYKKYGSHFGHCASYWAVLKHTAFRKLRLCSSSDIRKERFLLGWALRKSSSRSTGWEVQFSKYCTGKNWGRCTVAETVYARKEGLACSLCVRMRSRNYVCVRARVFVCMCACLRLHPFHLLNVWEYLKHVEKSIFLNSYDITVSLLILLQCQHNSSITR
jgi:hypothetical protein